MKRGEKLAFILITVLSVGILLSPQFSNAQEVAQAEMWLATLTSAEGGVYIKRAGQTQWAPVKITEKFFPGDTLRVEEESRAALLFSNESNMRLDQNTTLVLRGMEDQTVLMQILNGSASCFSRIQRSLKMFTPHVNGNVKGTEFFVRVDAGGTFISLFEGQMLTENEQGSLLLSSGQSALARAGEAPTAVVVVRPRDAVQWALYYPPILDFRPDDFRDADDLNYQLYRASLLLHVGRVDEANAAINRALKRDPQSSPAYALKAIIAVVQNRKDEGLDLAKKAVESDPKSSPALLALSYARQARFDLKGALQSVQEAVRFSPNDAFARARLAELWLSQGYLDRALEEAKRATMANPDLARAQSVLGYAYLTQVKVEEAKEAFNRAISLDSADPLPRLGLGLARIRKGDLKGGRQEIEIAASLDANNALVRSYLGKAYYEEKRENLSATQFGSAKEIDPSDPTPWFYDAILKQSVNRPVEALQDIQKSIELNENRAVYRSRLLLDEDLAARSASLGRIYGDLGFSALGLVEAWKSVNYDPTSFSAHRLMADLYASEPRHKIARVSEVLQSQLLQPININPVQPQFADSNLNIFKGAGPANPSYNEYNPLFNRNQVSLQASGVYGQKGILGDEVSLNAVYDRLSFSVGQFYYESDGFRANNDQRKEIYNLFAQGMLSYKTSIQLEARYTDHQYGDLPLLFDPNWYYSDQRQTDRFRYFRGGLHHSFAPGHDLILNLSYNNDDGRAHIHIPPANDPNEFTFDLLWDLQNDPKGYLAEGQYLFRSDLFRAIVGGGYADIDGTRISDDQLTVYFGGGPIDSLQSHTEGDYDVHHSNAYTYTYTNFPQYVTWTLGLGYDVWNDTSQDRRKDKVNPKAGVIWNPIPSTTLRAAAFRVLKRTLISSQTIEPTQVAGFNQFFDEVPGTDYWRYGVGLDQKILSNLFAGVELSKRDMNVPYINSTIEGNENNETKWKEELARLYLYWAPHPWLALTAEYRYERFNRDPEFVGVEQIRTADTHRVPLGVNFYHPTGFIAQFKATWVDQEGDFVDWNKTWTTPPYVENLYSTWSDTFWVCDALIGYRLPKRYGLIAIEVKNIFDQGVRFQDTDPASPSIFPDRTIIGRITLNF
jgi:tetratricopeptide (TPR) repeat protein/opacity protein-like surface antigen